MTEIKEDRRYIEYRGNPKRDLVRAYNIRESEIDYLGAKKIVNKGEKIASRPLSKQWKRKPFGKTGWTI